MKKIIIISGRRFTLDGVMAFGKLENGLHTADFACCEDVELEPFAGQFKVQAMRDGNIYMQERKKRVRNNTLLIRKAKHGRVSGTRDKAWQMTLKVFAVEGIDWQKVFVEEPIEVMTDLMGRQRMRKILTDALKRLDSDEQTENNWRPFGQEW